MRGILFLVIALIMCACGSDASKIKQDTATEFRMVVNDSVIAMGEVKKITFPLMWYFDIYTDEKAMVNSKAAMSFTKSQVMLYAVEQYFAGVGAGGHHQYFSDPAGILWKDALAGLDIMELPEYHRILSTVVARMGGNPPLDVKERNLLLDSLDLGFSKEDSLFFELRKKLDPDQKMMQFVRKNSREFYFDRMVKKPN